MKKVKSLKDLSNFMEKLGATKETEPGFTRWTLTNNELLQAVDKILPDNDRSKLIECYPENAKKRS
jgi:hypothetical protein